METLLSDPVLTCAEAKAWEKQLLSSEALEWAAMQKAGAALASSLLEDFKEIGGLPANARLLVLCGKGHNGGDALLAAGAIAKAFPQSRVDVLACFDASVLRPLARRCLDDVRQIAGERFRHVTLGLLENELLEYDICLDGLFGFQFRPPMDAATARIVGWVNAQPRIKLRAAVDLPSGVGEANGATVFRADFTYATGIIKSPVVRETNGAHVGRLRYLDLGFFGKQEPENSERVLSGKLLRSLSELRSSQSDKRTFGHLCIVGGSHHFPGAVVLAARAALRSGVGLVTAFVPEALAPQAAARHPEVMWVGCPLTGGGGLSLAGLELMREPMKRATALLIGPGLGTDPETLQLVRQLAAQLSRPMVFDADALRPEIVREVLTKPFVCTPHAGEFKRIAPTLYAGDRSVAPRGVIVLKGPLTHVTDGRKTYYSPFGGPVLARGGSGDMLAGLIGGLLAQNPDNPLLAACRGVVWHGVAADLLARSHGQIAVENSQLLEQLGPALNLPHGRLTDGATGVHGAERPAQYRPDYT